MKKLFLSMLTISLVLPTQVLAREVIVTRDSTGSGHLDFKERADRSEFSTEVEDLTDGSYRIFVGGIDRGGLEFRDPVVPAKILLDFNPRGQQIDVLDGTAVILNSLFPSG